MYVKQTGFTELTTHSVLYPDKTHSTFVYITYYAHLINITHQTTKFVLSLSLRL